MNKHGIESLATEIINICQRRKAGSTILKYVRKYISVLPSQYQQPHKYLTQANITNVSTSKLVKVLSPFKYKQTLKEKYLEFHESIIEQHGQMDQFTRDIGSITKPMDLAE